MKHLIYLIIAVLMVSCDSGTSNKYEQTIKEYITEVKSNELGFKVQEIAEQGTVTVADSISYLTDEFRKDQQLIIKRIELAKKMSEDLLSKTKKQNDIYKYNADIVRMNNTIDSLKNVTPTNLNGYDSKNPTDVLAVVVRCKYSFQPPGMSTVEETFDFHISPDGTKCYGKKGIK